MAPTMSDYDEEAWREIKEWRERLTRTPGRRLMPETLRHRIRRGGRSAREFVEAIPGVSAFERTIGDAVDGLVGTLTDAAIATVRRDAILAAYRRKGHEINRLSQIAHLDLEQLDSIRPSLGMAVSYALGSAAEGAAAGFVVLGGEIEMAGGSVVGGVGAAPGIATVLGVMAGDSAATLATASRLVAHTATYYGYDITKDSERVFLLGILNLGTATSQAGKLAAYQDLNLVIQQLARRAAWRALDEHGTTQFMKRLYAALGYRLTKNKLGEALPVIGIAVGAGTNANLMRRLVRDASFVYRERFLREKYGVKVEPVTAESEPVDGTDVISIAAELETVAQSDGHTSDGASLRQHGRFTLQFNPSQIEPLAGRYGYVDDTSCVAAGKSARERGYYTRASFITVCRWKTPRSIALVEANTAAGIKQATQDGLAASNDVQAIDALTSLSGVGVPTASTLLHFAHPTRYPILDVRALASLGCTARTTYPATFWAEYAAACRHISASNGVSLRTLDKALWEFSKERSQSDR